LRGGRNEIGVGVPAQGAAYRAWERKKKKKTARRGLGKEKIAESSKALKHRQNLIGKTDGPKSKKREKRADGQPY